MAKSCLKKAESYARVQDRDKEIRVSHVIFAILNDKKYNIVIDVLTEMNVDADLLTDSVEVVRMENVERQETKPQTIKNGKELDEILNYALENTIIFDTKENASIIDIFLACLEIDNELTETFKDFHVNYEEFKEIATDFEANEYETEYEGMEFVEALTSSQSKSTGKIDTVEKYCQNLNKLATEGKLDSCIGREKEIQQLYRILTRTKKRNAILIGREGVGKTNLVEGLAYNIVKNKVPQVLSNKTIYSLDLNSLIAGTTFRGMFEERIQKILEELNSNGNAILFIDEIHNIVGAGASEGVRDLANVLKPYLARKSFQVIGATTLSEYQKIFERDKALSRRFSEVGIDEPSIEDTILILQKVKKGIEEAHNVRISQDVIRSCVELSHKYMPYRMLPDKAIDILDDVSAKVRINNSMDAELSRLQKEYEIIESKKVDIIRNKTYHLAEEVKKDSQKLLSKLKSQKNKKNTGKTIDISVDEVKTIIHEYTKIPITNDGINIQELKLHLKANVIGQDHAIDSIAKAMMLNKLNLDDYEKPIGTFMFIGFSGVGKTEITKQISKFLGTEKSLIRIDCSEYSHGHEITRLVGAPPSYVGYEDGGILTEAVKRNPFSVVLFDEIEKAHEKLFDLLLQIIGEGRLTDNKGETINFKNTVIILTSNIGTKSVIQSRSGIGFGDAVQGYDKAVVEKEVRKFFKPEFINRLDEVVHFNILTKENIFTLMDLEFAKLVKQVQKHGVTLKISEEVKEYLFEKEYIPEYGFRPFKRYISNEVKTLIAEILLEQKPKEIKISLEDQKIKAVI
jgi:ATP-dependent Clp protease ATP-binding subunit ClpC